MKNKAGKAKKSVKKRSAKSSGNKKRKAVVIYFSSTGNTKKLVEAIAKGIESKLSVRVIPVSKAKKSDIAGADLVGMGSGIYAWSPSRKLMKFVKSLPAGKERIGFTFSTSGSGRDIQLTPLKREMNKKGLCIAGSFSVKGKDTFGPLKWFGGIYKDRPNKEDLKKAEKFGREMADIF